MADFPIWKTFTIRLGTGLKAPDDFRRAFKENGCRIPELYPPNSGIIDQPGFTVAKKCTEVDLAVVSVDDLHLKARGTVGDRLIRTKDVYKRALEYGLKSCPAEVGPQLRLQYKDQHKDRDNDYFGWTVRLVIGMEPIMAPDGSVYVFELGVSRGYSENLMLGTHEGNATWNNAYAYKFVFMLASRPC